jgi:hypothetical protein
MPDVFRPAATGFIWLVVMIISTVAIVSPGGNLSGNDIIPIIAITAFMAAVSTWSIWRSAGTSQHSAAMTASAAEKLKRTSKDRLSRMLNALDDDEAAAMLEDFKSRLAGGDSDGEVSAVEMLRAERRQRD